jgi:hypothetical protein
MVIEDARKNQRDTFFYELIIGSTFEYNEELWLKINDEEGFNLNDEYITTFGDNTLVMKVNVKITIID